LGRSATGGKKEYVDNCTKDTRNTYTEMALKNKSKAKEVSDRVNKQAHRQK
jgi:hypothetical protein